MNTYKYERTASHSNNIVITCKNISLLLSLNYSKNWEKLHSEDRYLTCNPHEVSFSILSVFYRIGKSEWNVFVFGFLL